MYCSSCGKENNNDAKFCYYCGAPINNGVPMNNDEKKEKKSNKGRDRKKGFIIAAVLLAAILMIGVVTAAAFPKIERAVLGESAYYLTQEYSNIRTLLDAGSITELRHPQSYSAKSELTMDYDASEEYYAEDFKELYQSIKLTSQVDYDKTNGAVGVNADMLYDDEALYSFRFDYLNRQLAMKSNLLESSLMLYSESKKATSSLDSKKASDNSAKSADNSENSNVNSDVIDTAINIGENLLKNTVDKENVSTSKEVFKETEYDTVVFSFTDKQADALIINILEELLKSDDIKALINNYSDVLLLIAEENGYESASAIDYINELLNEFKEYGICNFDRLNVKVFYDSKGKIVAREISINYETYTEKIIIESNISNDSSEVSVIVDYEDDEYFNVSYKKTMHDNKMDLFVTCDVISDESQRIFECHIDDMESRMCNGIHTICGSLDFNYADSVNFKLTADINDNKHNVYWNCDVWETVVSGQLTTVLSTDFDVSAVSIPEQYEINIDDYFDDLINEINNTFEEKVLNPLEEKYYYDDGYLDSYDYYM